MQGIKNFVLGSVLIAAGGGILMTVNLRGMLEYGAWGILVVGVLMFAAGLYQLLVVARITVDATEAYNTNSTARLLMQSMLTTALADGHLDDHEVETITEACEAVVDEHLDPDSIRRIANLIEERGDAILEEIRYEGKMLNIDGRKAIINACVMVLMADGQVDVRGTAAINVIGEQLDFSTIETQALIAEAMAAEQG
jgi:uncharacterized tellurite resistance protein B-like protein